MEGAPPDPARVAAIRRRLQAIFTLVIVACGGLALGVGLAEHSLGWAVVALFVSGVVCLLTGTIGVIVLGEAKAVMRLFRHR